MVDLLCRGGGLVPGARVWIPREGEDGNNVGWIKGKLLSANKCEDNGAMTFHVEEDENRSSSLEGNFTLSDSHHRPITRVITSKRSPEGNYPDIHLRNEELEMDASEGEASMVDDLITLTHLHEPAILHTIELRYWKELIYTYTGPILIACNPFKRLAIYSDDHVAAYRRAGQEAVAIMAGVVATGKGDENEGEGQRGLPPHIYAVADAAYRSMVGPLSAQGMPPNQSILVSGESGAGKTESTKFIMQYLAVISTTTSNINTIAEDDCTISSQVLQSNPILESFGNARTIRNDNSSRFGKFIELHFDKANGRLSGASIATYLLEKVRIVSQSTSERSYHIFYQMLSGVSPEEREKLHLGSRDQVAGGGFHYISQSGCFSRLDGADDAQDYRRMRRAMTIMGFDQKEQFKIMKVVAAVLHLGNLTFTIRGSEDQNSPESAQVAKEAMKVVSIVAELLEVEPEAFMQSLTNRNIQAGREMVNVNLTPAQAEGARDALAKAVYGGLFLWIVNRVNEAIGLKEEDSNTDGRSFDGGIHPRHVFASPIKVGNGASSSSGNMFIGVLDIFGFESFQRNCFEQLCINYANETLQQQFNQFVFKLEQEEYDREEISWSFVEFPDNQECLDLLENRTAGILALLDEQCVVPKATDQTLASRLYEKCKDHPRFTVSPWDRVDFRFTVQHYAGSVTYDTHGFLDKNKDQLYQETIDLLQSSSCLVVQSLLKQGSADPAVLPGDAGSMTSSPSLGTTSRGTPSQGKRRSAVAPLTVGSQFKGQLGCLLTRIRSTRPHYVRCLKPNDSNVPCAFDQARIIEQLRCGGVLEAVRVSRAGYPTRMPHSQFYHRYRPLALGQFEKVKHEAKHHGLSYREMDRALAEAVVRELMMILWKKRQGEVTALPSEGERAVLSFKEQLAHVGLQLGITKVFFRLQAFEEIETMRGRLMQMMAVKLQSILRGFTRHHQYQRVKRSTLTGQRLIRGFLGRRRTLHLRRSLSATHIQKLVRGAQARTKFRMVANMIVRLQSLRRGILVRKQVRQIREIRASIKLQAWSRMALERKKLNEARSAATSLETYVRRFLAKREFRRRRIAARDLGNVAKQRDTLLITIKELKAELVNVTEERDQALLKVREVSIRLEKVSQSPSTISTTSHLEVKPAGIDESSLHALHYEDRIKELEAEVSQLRLRCVSLQKPSESEVPLLHSRIADLEKQLALEKRRTGVVPPSASMAASIGSQGNKADEEIAGLRGRVKELWAQLLSARQALSQSAEKVTESKDGTIFGYKQQIKDLQLQLAEAQARAEDRSVSRKEEIALVGPGALSDGGAASSGDDTQQNRNAEGEFFTTLSQSASSSLRSGKDSFYSAISDLDAGLSGITGNDSMQSPSVVERNFEVGSLGTLSPAQTDEGRNDEGEEENEGHEMVTPPEMFGPITNAWNVLDFTEEMTSPGLKTRFVSTMSEMSTKNFLITFAKAEDTDVVLDMMRHRLSKEPTEEWPCLLNSTDRDGRTPLHLASLGGSSCIAELLLNHGASANFYDKRDDTPLHLSNCDAVTRVLLNYGANPALPNRMREISLHVAIKNRDILSVHAILQHPNHKKFINEQDEYGSTPLHVATRVGSLDAVALLIDHGASMDIVDREGMRPIHVICASLDQLENGPGIVHYLLHRGANPSIRTTLRGLTPLHLLADNPSFVSHPHQLMAMADLILDRDVEPDVSALDGSTPLHYAARNNFEEMAALLIRRGGCLTIPWRLPAGGDNSVGSSLSASSRGTSGTTPSCGSVASSPPRTCDVLAVEIFNERSPSQLYRMISQISTPQEQVKDKSRSSCMECRSLFTIINRRHHCRFCQRLLCHSCSSAQISKDFFPPNFSEAMEDASKSILRVCNVCYQILTKREADAGRDGGSIDRVNEIMSVMSNGGNGRTDNSSSQNR